MTIYDFAFTDASGAKKSFAEFGESVFLIVNTATKCGFSPQFEELEALHQKYKDKGLIVLGFPCDQFLNQEPETNETVANVCLVNFGVTFPLSEKIAVNGEHTDPVFKYLKESLPGTLLTQGIKWNFTKFLIAKTGKPYKRYAPTFSPKYIENDIKKLLDEPSTFGTN